MVGRGDFSTMAFYVYILRLSNNQLDAGSTEDLARRFTEYQAGSGGRTTALFQPLNLFIPNLIQTVPPLSNANAS
jgi:predicted GIY-YIG superfamily endonuclease